MTAFTPDEALILDNLSGSTVEDVQALILRILGEPLPEPEPEPPPAVAQVTIATLQDDADAIDVADLTGNGLVDLLVVAENGKLFWYEQATPGAFTRHQIRGRIDGAKYEGGCWGDFDRDGHFEAYSADQKKGQIKCTRQLAPGNPWGDWKTGTLATDKRNLQNLRVIEIGGGPALLFTWEGDEPGDGGVGMLRYDGSRPPTSDRAWTYARLVEHEGAWWIDPAGIVNGRLHYSARRNRNPAARGGAFYLTVPSDPAGPWHAGTIYESARDWSHIATGDFFGEGNVDVAIHDRGSLVRLFASTGGYLDLPMTPELGRYNLRNLGHQKNGRDVLLCLGEEGGGLWRWSGAAWEWRELAGLLTEKCDGPTPMADLTGDGVPDVLLLDSFGRRLSYLDGAALAAM